MAGGIALQSSSGGTVTFTIPETSTSSTVSLDFTSLKSTNGYQKLPGGIIIQWGTTASIASGATVTTNLPISFPSSFVNIQISRLEASTAASYRGGVVINNTSQFTFYNSERTAPFFYIAIGY